VGLAAGGVDIKRGEVGQVLVLNIGIGLRELQVLVVVSRADVPYPVVFWLVSDLCEQLRRPFVAVIRPGTFPLLDAPRVPHFDEFLSVAQLHCAEDRVRVSVGQAVGVGILITAVALKARGRDHPVVLEFPVKVVPEFVDANFVVVCVEEWRACHCLHSNSHLTARQHFIIPEQLCRGFFQDWIPQTVVHCAPTVNQTVLAFIQEGQVLVDGDSHWDAHDVHLEGVDAGCVQHLRLEHLFDAFWVSCHSCRRRVQPAVAQ